MKITLKPLAMAAFVYSGTMTPAVAIAAEGTPVKLNFGAKDTINSLNYYGSGSKYGYARDSLWNLNLLNRYNKTTGNGDGTISMYYPGITGGQCTSLAISLAKMSARKTDWIQGDKVSDNTAPYSVIATFDSSGNYYGHMAIFLGKNGGEIAVLDQNWSGSANEPVGQIRIHTISNSGTGVNNSNNYYVVNKR